MAGLRCAPGMRHEGQPVQQMTPQERRGNLSQAGGEEGSCESEYLNKLVQKKERENDFGRTFLKLCGVMIG